MIQFYKDAYSKYKIRKQMKRSDKNTKKSEANEKVPGSLLQYICLLMLVILLFYHVYVVVCVRGESCRLDKPKISDLVPVKPDSFENLMMMYILSITVCFLARVPDFVVNELVILLLTV